MFHISHELTLDQKLQKSMSCQRTQKMMMMKESQQRTMYKNNSRNSNRLKVCDTLQLHHKLKDWSPETDYYSYTHRCGALNC